MAEVCNPAGSWQPPIKVISVYLARPGSEPSVRISLNLSMNVLGGTSSGEKENQFSIPPNHQIKQSDRIQKLKKNDLLKIVFLQLPICNLPTFLEPEAEITIRFVNGKLIMFLLPPWYRLRGETIDCSIAPLAVISRDMV